MTESIKNIYRMLRPLSLYMLNGQSGVDCELMAMDSGFALLENELSTLFAESFVQTAGSFGLRLREELLQLPMSSQFSIEAMRERILYRLAVAPTDFNLEGIQNAMRGAGLDAVIEEFPGEYKIKVEGETFVSDSFFDSLKEDVLKMLPAHLFVDFEIGNLTWSAIDSADNSFGQLDSMDFDWYTFDLRGHLLFS